MTELYPRSPEPAFTDGRDIDLRVGALSGEAALQVSAGGPDPHQQQHADVWAHLPEPRVDDPTYYDRPLLQRSVWSWAIPVYYYVGGLSGASMALAAAATVRPTEHSRDFVYRAHLVGFVGTVLSGALLVYDLGRPSRFLNMLRVFRPTSPMNIGAWILSGTGGTAFCTVLLARQDGLLGFIGKGSGVVSGIFGLGLATYTGVLVANSAVPVWQSSRKSLPALFGSSAVASVGCAFDLFGGDEPSAHITHTFGILGRVAELAGGISMEREAGATERVALPLRRGWSGALFRASAVLTATSLLLTLLPNGTRQRRRWSGALGTLGSLLLRFSVESAGQASASDSRASFHQQRRFGVNV